MDDITQDIINTYQNNQSLTQTAKIYKKAPMTIKKILADNNITIKTAQTTNQIIEQLFNHISREDLIKDYEKYSIPELANKYSEYTEQPIGKSAMGKILTQLSITKQKKTFANTDDERTVLLRNEYDYTKNPIKDINNIILMDKKIKYYWLCPLGHSYEMTMNKRYYYKYNCLICSGKIVLPGYNDLESQNPDVLQYWDYEKNDIAPNEITATSGKKAWWKCEKGHSYESKIASKNNKNFRNTGCPYCTMQRRIPGENDLFTVYPNLKEYWDYEKNNGIDTTTLALNTMKKYYWICENGHSDIRSISSLVSTGKYLCNYCNNNKIISGYNDVATTHPNVIKEWNYNKNTISPQNITYGNNKKIYWICSNNHEWISILKDKIRYQNKCRICSNNGTSKSEKELNEYIKSIYAGELIENNRTIIHPYELDTYLPEANIAIEYNGLYWHSEKFTKDKNYHYNKYTRCKELGIQLIQIWEDDWNLRRPIIEKTIAHKLNVNHNNKIYARKTTAEYISYQEAYDFLENNHIQGGITGTVYLGLKYSNELAAVMVFNKIDKDTISLARYATSANVIGGFTKLLAYFENNNIEYKKITTFSDNEISDGGLYKNNGFIMDKLLPPDYKYVHKGIRTHKFLFRKTNFKTNPQLKYEEGLTERQLAELNGLYRVYDSGKIKWVKTIER